MSNSDIQGRVKTDTIDALFNLGHLPNPDILTTEIQSALNSYNEFARNNNKTDKTKLTFLEMLRKPKKSNKPHLKTYTRLSDFIRAIKNGYFKNKNIDVFDGNYVVDLWYKIQDIRSVLEIRCVSKHSQGQYVLASKNIMLGLNRVIENPQDYLKL